MSITDILSPECVRVPLVARGKLQAIAELVDVLAYAGRLSDRDAVLESVLTRERTRSTGIGQGLAVPHGKSRGCPTLAMAIGRPVEPIDFDSPDGLPCIAVVLLASPFDKAGPHIQALASISRLWLDERFRRAVAEAVDGAALYGAVDRLGG